MPEVYEDLAKYIDFYNNRRWHSSLRNKTPYGVLCEGKINDNRRKLHHAVKLKNRSKRFKDWGSP